MIESNTLKVTAPAGEYSDTEARQLLLRCEQEHRFIEKPANAKVAKQLRRSAHAIVAERLLQARNRSGINNERINQAMHGLYLSRRREAKAWTFTNSVSTRLTYLPDWEEIEMLAEILPTTEEIIGLHLKVIPWALADQREEAKKRKGKDNPPMPKDLTPTAPASQQASASSVPTKTQQHPQGPATQMSAGDLKISHEGGRIHVHGKVWCDRKTAQQLRMIVPLKLLQQAHGDNPWSYEMKGPVHDYQLYNLMHVLYGAPRVLQVQLD
tara:strand:+ start:284 stop:1087 length:804 start_codon:yes stop_codon:yes gene_type:complete